MKVPATPPTYSKEKGLTRRTVKGAAGGMLGADYEDTRHNDVNTVRAHNEVGTSGLGDNRSGSPASLQAGAAAQTARAPAEGMGEAKLGGPKEEQEMVLDDEDATSRDVKKRQRQQQVARDRLTIDKDAPELRRNRALWAKVMGEDDRDEDPEEREGSGHAPDPEELDLEAIGEAIAQAGDDAPLDRARFFSRPDRSRVGDPTLTDPSSIRSVLRTPIAYAKHVMVLGEAFQRTTGAHRGEVVQYMAAMYAAMPDRSFARQALKEFGPSTGVLDVYPLEIVEELVLRYPGSLPKVGFGRLFVRPKADSAQALELVEGRSSPLRYPKNLKVRGFAIKGGGDPGYLFEPSETPGQYSLRIDAPGRYTVMISAITRSGHTIVDTLHVNVRPAGRRPRGRALAPRAPAVLRDPVKVARWPKPAVRPADLSDLLAQASAQVQDTLLSMGELVSKSQQSAMRGPMGDDHEDYGWSEANKAPTSETSSRAAPEVVPEAELEDEETPPPEKLSAAEQAVLRLALATQLSSDDLIAALDGPDPWDDGPPSSPSSQPQAEDHGASEAFARPPEDVAPAEPDPPAARSALESVAPEPDAAGPEAERPPPVASTEPDTLAEVAALTPAPEPKVERAPEPPPEPAPERQASTPRAPSVRSGPSKSGSRPAIRVARARQPASARAPTPNPEPAPHAATLSPAPTVGAAPSPTSPGPTLDADPAPATEVVRVRSEAPATEVVRVRSEAPSSSRPRLSEPLVTAPRSFAPPPTISQILLQNIPIRNPMDDREPTDAPETSGGFLADGRGLPTEAQGETDSEVPAYRPTPRPVTPVPQGGQRHLQTEIVRVRKKAEPPVADTMRIDVQDLVLEEPE